MKRPMKAKKKRLLKVLIDESLYRVLRKEGQERTLTLSGYLRFILVMRHGIPSGTYPNLPAPRPFHRGRG